MPARHPRRHAVLGLRPRRTGGRPTSPRRIRGSAHHPPARPRGIPRHRSRAAGLCPGDDRQDRRSAGARLHERPCPGLQAPPLTLAPSPGSTSRRCTIGSSATSPQLATTSRPSTCSPTGAWQINRSTAAGTPNFRIPPEGWGSSPCARAAAGRCPRRALSGPPAGGHATAAAAPRCSSRRCLGHRRSARRVLAKAASPPRTPPANSSTSPCRTPSNNGREPGTGRQRGSRSKSTSATASPTLQTHRHSLTPT